MLLAHQDGDMNVERDGTVDKSKSEDACDFLIGAKAATRQQFTDASRKGWRSTWWTSLQRSWPHTRRREAAFWTRGGSPAVTHEVGETIVVIVLHSRRPTF